MNEWWIRIQVLLSMSMTARGSCHPEEFRVVRSCHPDEFRVGLGIALATFGEVDWLMERKADEQRCENPYTVCANFKRFFMLTRLKTLRIIFTVMVKQAEIGRFLEELGI